jgi:hypothetical protein
MERIRTWRADELEKKPDSAAEVKAWFRRCRSLAEAIHNQREKVARLRDAATHITQNLNGMPTASGNGNKILEVVCDRDAEIRKLNNMETELVKRRMEAITRVFCIVYAEDGYSIRIADYLRSYYIDCETTGKYGYFKLKTYDNVAEEYDVSVKTVANGLKNGLEALAEIWPDITRDRA